MALENKLIGVEGYKKAGELVDIEYIVTKLPATKGLKVQLKLIDGLDVDLIKEVVLASVALGSVKMTEKLFDEHFSGRYGHLMDLFHKIIEFNFDENFTESDSEEK